MKKKIERIGVITSGGDCSGLNAAIRACTCSAIRRGWKVYGIHNGINGLIVRPMEYEQLTLASFEFPFATLGGTMLGTNNSNVLSYDSGKREKISEQEVVARFTEGVQKLKLDALIVIGGDGSMTIIANLCKRAHIAMIGIPKTIDNDAPGTDLSIGFSTAREVVMDAMDKLDTTAASHHRVMLVEVMGRTTGHLALQSAITGFADAVLIPEIPYSYDALVKHLRAAQKIGRGHALVVISEGIKKPDGNYAIANDGATYFGVSSATYYGVSQYFQERLKKDGFEVRTNILGHIQRSGTPVAADRLLASAFGVHAIDLLAKGKTNRVVVHAKGEVSDISLKESISLGTTPVNPRGEIVKVAQSLGIYVGEVDQCKKRK
ncbi:MAG: ATP-dependent 6-phosphofructokinase [Alphaproteobacteria bacterium]|nr:ATP-dependent 6-phosphofructokinase [Alphaproteobacteria bacterium]